MRHAICSLLLVAVCSGPALAQTRGEESATRPTSADELLATAVHRALGRDGRVSAQHVRVSARDGVVELTGTVPRQADRDAAEEIARGVTDVRDVTNKLIVPATAGTPGTSMIPECASHGARRAAPSETAGAHAA